MTTSSPSPVLSSISPVPTPSSSSSMTANTISRNMLSADHGQEVPIFLRKTYHMIDTCDPDVACWSDDGETFVVKDPDRFEKQIIPQFFKHSKFTSFVRQLNFYSFRKIKYVDSIRIDPKLEAETANYWRFRHERFQRGKPELLGEIKRMNGQKHQQKKDTTQSSAAAVQENAELKSEVSSLKQRIEAMTKNIDELTNMVQKVTLATQQQTPEETQINQNNKRAKVEETPDVPISAPVAVAASPRVQPVEAPVDSMELDSFPLPPSIPSPMPVEDRPVTSSTELSDEGFVDQLFTAFKTEEFEFDESEKMPSQDDSNRPSPGLMNRLGDALSVLPRDIQELIVDRLIQAITSPKEIQENISAVNALKQVDTKKDKAAVVSTLATPPKDPKQIANLQLAAATLAALLSQCGAETLKDTHSSKNLLIPVHA